MKITGSLPKGVEGIPAEEFLDYGYAQDQKSVSSCFLSFHATLTGR